jgi:hypothetical protein
MCKFGDKRKPGTAATNYDKLKSAFKQHYGKCTGNGLVVPSSSHKREVADSIPVWVHKKLLSPLFCCHLTD